MPQELEEYHVRMDVHLAISGHGNSMGLLFRLIACYETMISDYFTRIFINILSYKRILISLFKFQLLSFRLNDVEIRMTSREFIVQILFFLVGILES